MVVGRDDRTVRAARLDEWEVLAMSKTDDGIARPDPSALTREIVSAAIEQGRRDLAAQLQILEARFTAVETADSLRGQVVAEKFSSVAQQFKERDTRSERESRDNKTAVDAAFAAQKEAAAAQNESNTLAITKSGAATAETITKNAELFAGNVKSLTDKVDDLRDRLGALELRLSTRLERADGGDTGRAGASDRLNRTITVGLTVAAVVIALVALVTGLLLR